MIIDLLKTFAAMPDRAGVLKAFDRSEGKFAGYDQLKADIEAMPIPVPIPEIKEFIFGLTPENINEHIKNIRDVTMMLEYGIFSFDNLFDARARKGEFMLSIFIFKPHDVRNTDIIEEVMIMEELMQIVRKMLRHIEALDKAVCGAKRLMDRPVKILPIQPFQILNVKGWEIAFAKDCNDLFFW